MIDAAHQLADLWVLIVGLFGLLAAVLRLFFRVDAMEKITANHADSITETKTMIITMREESRKSLEDYAQLEREEHEKIIKGVEKQVDGIKAELKDSMNKIEAKIDTLVQYNLNNKS